MNRIKNIILSTLAVIFITLLLLIVLNFALVAYAPHLVRQPLFPRSLLNEIDRCYQTYYPAVSDATLDNYIAVLGDSYAAGLGDEFLGGDFNYGAIHKLHEKDNLNYLVFGRGGYGSINSLAEFNFCRKLTESSWITKQIEKPSKILFFFYEGNDLNNNNDHLKTMSSQTIDNFVFTESDKFDRDRFIDYHKPLYFLLRFAKRKITMKIGRILGVQDDANPDNTSILSGSNNLISLKNSVAQGPETAQSAAVELSGQELDNALDTFYSVLKLLSKQNPETPIEIIYIPSIVTSYDWKSSKIHIESYTTTKGNVFTTSENNTKYSDEIRRRISKFAADNNFSFTDTTNRIKKIGRVDLVHGPIDWRHFNKLGYEAVSAEIKNSESRSLH